MKRSVTALAVLAATAFAPRDAQAKAVEDVMLAADAQDLVLTVIADEPLRAPTIRTYAGSVRIRFYDAKDTPLLRLTGDGGAVRSVDVSEGSDKSAAVVMVLGDRTRLAPTDVRVERAGEKTVFRISRGLLPALREGSPMPTAQAVAPKPVARPAAQPTPSAAPVAIAQAPAAAPAAPVQAVQPAPAPAIAPAPEAPSPVTALGVKKAPAKAPAPEKVKLGQDAGSSTLPMLLSITALLALAYGAIRLFLKKNDGIEIPAIDIVAQKRLGPRHQLVIVRAFDRDYLLSIQGGQTTVVARSSRSKQIAASEALLSPLPQKRSSTPSVTGRPINPELERELGRDFEDDEVTFGGELFKTALEQRERARDVTERARESTDRPRDTRDGRAPSERVREQTAGFRLEAARAEARAELARHDATRHELGREDALRTEAARRDALRSEPIRNDALRSESLRAELARGDALDPADELGLADDIRIPSGLAESTPDAMSESVSGLMRLRKASGR
jgi:flagellar biogenesis protein FliO